MTDKFPTQFYEAHSIAVCPNGDKLRSDDEGLFCLVEGDRTAAELVNGAVVLKPVEKATSKKKKGESSTEQQTAEDLSNAHG